MINIHALSGRMGNEMFRHAYLYAQVRKGVIPDVYLQDPKFFEGYEEEIKELFGEGIGYLEQVGVHIRRAVNPTVPSEPKYSENPFYVNLTEDTDYYDRAMVMFPDDNFLVFSDDPDWCKEKFNDNPRVQVMEKGDGVNDFNLLASCKDLIIANSSFSWWAAYLCPNEGKKVVAPSKEHWYKNGVERTVCPKEWIRI